MGGDRATSYGMCFRLDLCIPSYSERSNGCAFSADVFVRLTVLPLQGFEVTRPTFSKTLRRVRSFDIVECACAVT